MKTEIHKIYNESLHKIYENPIVLDALVGQPQWETKMTAFGPEQVNKLEVFLHLNDLKHKEVTVFEGDFFTYGNIAYEIVSALDINNYFGQVEHDIGIKILGINSRNTEFNPKQLLGPTEPTTPPAPFQQQRGLPENMDGPTGDVRDVRERLDDELAPVALDTGPRVVAVDLSGKAAVFYKD